MVQSNTGYEPNNVEGAGEELSQLIVLSNFSEGRKSPIRCSTDSPTRVISNALVIQLVRFDMLLQGHIICVRCCSSLRILSFHNDESKNAG